MLNQDRPKAYVLASGEMHSVREFLDKSLEFAGIEFVSKGSEDEEKYFTKDGQLIFEINANGLTIRNTLDMKWSHDPLGVTQRAKDARASLHVQVTPFG